MVAAIQNGTVIDHIPSNKLFQVMRLLHLEEMTSSVTVGFNMPNTKDGNEEHH